MISPNPETRTQIKTAIEETINVIMRHNLSKEDLLIEYFGRLAFTIGCSILGLSEKELSREEVMKLYADNPTFGAALACMGTDILVDWVPRIDKS